VIRPPQPQDIRESTLDRAEFAFSLSRRHALPFGVVALRVLDIERAVTQEGALLPRDFAERFRVEDTLRNALRRTDLMARSDDRGGYLVFCPSTPPEGLKELTERIQRLGSPRRILTGVASFEQDGLTLPDLIGEARKRAQPIEGVASSDTTRFPETPTATQPGFKDGRALWPVQFQRMSGHRRLRSMRLKRAFDLVFVLALAPVWAPVAGLVALAVKLSSPRDPILFVQQRTGLGGRRFGMVKFRTMVTNADVLKHQLRHLNQRRWPDFKIDEDPRITPLGRILRNTSLDELPQLWNVLRGDMSLVGPRPTSFTADTYDTWHTARLDVPPGMTGLWQIEKRDTVEFDERLRLDLEYIQRQGFFYDLWILFRTIRTVFEMRGGQ